MPKWQGEVASVGLTALLVAGLAIAPAAAEQVWKVQTSMSAGESFYTNIEQYWLPRLEEMTGGELQIELTPVGSVVPYNETMDAIGQGILQGDITATVYFSGRSKAFALLGDLIAGYETARADRHVLLPRRRPGAAAGGVRHLRRRQREGGRLRRDRARILHLQGPDPRHRGPEGRQGALARGPRRDRVRARRRLAGRPAVLRGLHLARQGRDRRLRLQLLHHGRERRPARDRQVPDLPRHPLDAGDPVHGQQGGLGQPDAGAADHPRRLVPGDDRRSRDDERDHRPRAGRARPERRLARRRGDRLVEGGPRPAARRSRPRPGPSSPRATSSPSAPTRPTSRS